MKTRITVVVDNHGGAPFAIEHGLALLVEADGGRFLFDTGAGDALVPNLERLGIVPASIHSVILSHGHNDHTGGLERLAPKDVWAAPDIGRRRFSLHPGQPPHDLSLPTAGAAVLARTHLHTVRAFTEIAPGVFLTGPIPRLSGETNGGPFFLDPDGRRPDDLSDEQALLLADGTLVTGCCHAGLMNTVDYCRRMQPGIPVCTVIGGLHLASAGQARLSATAAYVRQSGIRRLDLLHCTGAKAAAFLHAALPSIAVTLRPVGSSFTF